MKTDKTLFDLRLRIQELEDGSFEYDRSVDGEYAPFVEYEVRKRIEARGWGWTCGRRKNGKGGFYYAEIDAVDISDRDRMYDTWGEDTLAAALLTAYIAALEALNR